MSRSQALSRRKALAAIIGGTAVGVGGVYGLADQTEASAEVAADASLDDASIELDPDGNITEVSLTGEIEASHESPDVPIGKVGGYPTLYYRSTQPESATVDDLVDSIATAGEEFADPDDKHNGSVTIPFTLSLISGAPFEAEHFEPAPGERLVHNFELDVLVHIFETSPPDAPVAEVETTTSGRVEVERDERTDDGGNGNGNGNGEEQEPHVVLTKANFEFTIEDDS